MFGLDEWLASLSDGTALAAVLGVAAVLGFRHASDPDHLAAVTALLGGDRADGRRAGLLGLAWGAGHGASLLAFGLPIVVFRAYLPQVVQEAAETAVGLLIVALAGWLLVRWRRGLFHVHHHSGRPARGPWRAFGIGLLHGMGGSAGVGVLLLATIESKTLAVLALGLFGSCTAVSMSLVSLGVGSALGRTGALPRLAPAFGVAGLAFGSWYALGALSVVPYVL